MTALRITITIDELQLAALLDITKYLDDRQKGRDAPYNPTLTRSIERAMVIVGDIKAAYKYNLDKISQSHYNPKDPQ